MKTFAEFCGESFEPRKTKNRDDEFQKLMHEKTKDQKEFINNIDLKKTDFLNDVFDVLHGVKKLGKKVGPLDGMSFKPGKEYNLFTTYEGQEIVVKIDTSKIGITLCAVVSTDEEPIIVPVKKLD